MTKQAFCFVFDRVTGERASPTQPFPTRTAAFNLQGLTVDYLINFTPELRAEADAMLDDWVIGPLYTLPSTANQLMSPGTLGGADWSGAAVDPRTGGSL